MNDTGSAKAGNGSLQLRAVLEENQQPQQPNFNALAETLGSTLTHFRKTLMLLIT